MKVRFTVITPQDVLSFDLEDGTVILGRDRSCDHPLKDPTLERRHLALSHDGNRITATDLQTRAGTLLNGSSVERAALHDGDRLQIGECRIIASAVTRGDATAPSSFTNSTPVKRISTRKRPSLVKDDERFFIRIAKEWGLVNRARMRAILFVKHNNRVMGDQRRVEEICVRKGYLTITQVREIIAIWERMVVRCRACNSVFTPRDLTRTRRQVCPNCGQPLRRTLDFPGDTEEPAMLMTVAMEEGRALAVGEMFGGCRVDRFLAEGGSAEVYEGTHIGLSKKVAIKVLKRAYAGTAEHAHRFVEEARRVARLEHPHIVQVFNVGYEKSRYFIVYQFVEGRTLAELLTRYGKLPPDRARYITAACAAGLSEAHRHGIIHRDVKPENILVGRNRIVKVTDFGIAKDLRSGSSENTEPGMGTYLYLAPEQERDGPIDQRCDVYSLGLVLRYMLTGQKPPEGHRYVDIPTPRDANPEIGENLSAVVVKMLAKDPEQRYGSMKEVLDALRLCEFEESLPAPQPEAITADSQASYRAPILRAASLVLALGAAGLGGAFLMMPRHERDHLIARGLNWLRMSAPAAVPQEPIPATAVVAAEDHADVKPPPRAPIFTPPEPIHLDMLESFRERNFEAVCSVAELHKSSPNQELAAYSRRVLVAFQSLHRWKRVAASDSEESFVAPRPASAAEYDKFLPKAPTLVEKLRPGFFTQQMWNERKSDINNTRPDDAFPFASYFEAVAYCEWLTAQATNGFRYRLPAGGEIKSIVVDSSFWLGDLPIAGRYWIGTKNRQRLDAEPDSVMYQPAILPVVTVSTSYLKLLEEVLNGFDLASR